MGNKDNVIKAGWFVGGEFFESRAEAQAFSEEREFVDNGGKYSDDCIEAKEIYKKLIDKRIITYVSVEKMKVKITHYLCFEEYSEGFSMRIQDIELIDREKSKNLLLKMMIDDSLSGSKYFVENEEFIDLIKSSDKVKEIEKLVDRFNEIYENLNRCERKYCIGDKEVADIEKSSSPYTE